MTRKARILVVDDEDRFRQSLCRLLRAEGYPVEAACDGGEALNKLVTGQFDVVLLDMKMPGMSGAEVFGEIQLQGFDVETVCLTGHTSISDAMELLHNGVFDYLLKPASLPEIVNTVQRAMERKLLRHGEIGLTELLDGSASS